jgi:hypothetical protein
MVLKTTVKYVRCPLISSIGDIRRQIRDEFYEKLNDAELEYSTCKESLSEKNPLTGDSLYTKLAHNVAELSENSMNPAILQRNTSVTV